MKKKILGNIKLQILSGKATPTPPIGPALGQKGLNIVKFCKEFNERTKNKKKNLLLPVIITYYSDKSFDFIIKTPITSTLIKNILNIKKGSSKPNLEKIAKINLKQIKEIIKIKKNDLNSYSIKNSIKIIKGTLNSMGILIEKK
ncbi:50S ribosomal subunit protein L11 [Candidatus Zinderia insecticola CARI]|uniref:Large ribosomal subunit protein uL11 n=1 Tax=Zinderia insecticola (strain CARI) TaxID=871271 RepID=E0TIP2_ZINIC|nr:50S ribosomal subunit protein L11 [Candidatus Zinderia insecticola CARI]